MRYPVAHRRSPCFTDTTLANCDRRVNLKNDRVGQMGKKQKKMNRNQKPGPKPDILKLEGDWQSAVRQALTKKPPKKS
jgi:hypothetical protein